jgi:hypothetical protein
MSGRMALASFIIDAGETALPFNGCIICNTFLQRL